MKRKRLPDKPRARTGPKFATTPLQRLLRDRKRVRVVSMTTGSETTGQIQMADRAPSGRSTGVIIGSTGPQGGMSSPPSNRIAHLLRRRHLLINIPPAIIRDAEGKEIARIVVHPVTGKRTRVPSG